MKKMLTWLTVNKIYRSVTPASMNDLWNLFIQHFVHLSKVEMLIFSHLSVQCITEVLMQIQICIKRRK